MPFVRFIPLAASIAAALISLPGLPAPWAWALLASGVAFSCVGLYDLRQPLHSVRRNYPIVGRLRWFFEDIRPGLRQYLFEDDHEETPFSRSQRSLVYARAKNEVSDRAFGTLVDVYENGYEFIAHSTRPVPVADPAGFRIPIGGEACRQPYSASIFNISAMSFGALSANAIRALNKGAKLGGFAHDTGEGSISPYHREHGGDLIWEIGSGYFGCRDEEGAFDPGRFAEQAADPQVRMIELKISQGAKPGKGGILPAEKVTPEIAATRGIPMGRDCISPPGHSAFSTPIELLQFIAAEKQPWRESRTLSGVIGEHIVMARQAADGAWLVGAATNEDPRELDISLAFLGQGLYEALVMTDGDDSDYRTHKESYKAARRVVTRAETIRVKLAPGGGACLLLKTAN